MKKLLLLISIVTITSCQKEEIYEPIDPIVSETVAQSDNVSDSVDLYGEASKGLNIYLNSLDMNGRACVNCHLSPTGIDIAQFGKLTVKGQDSIVVHRALDHISKEEAYHIAAYIKSLNVNPNDNGSVGDFVGVDNDGVEPNQLWDGSTSLTINTINGWDFRSGVSYSFETPRWFKGDETNDLYDDNLDWLPEVDLLTEKGGDVSIAFQSYLSNPNKYTLNDVIKKAHYSLSEGERNPGEHGYNDFEKAFEYQRWIATLYMQHIIKPNSDLQFGEELPNTNIGEFSMADGIWDVGNIARRSQDNGSNVGNGDEIDNRLLNEVQWLYFGWLTNYGARNSFETQYIGTALKDFGEQDLASLVILKSLVSRSEHSQRMYDDIFTMSYITSSDMLYESMKFGLNYLIDGIESGDDYFTLLSDESIQVSLTYLGNDVLNNINSSSLTQTEKTELIGLVNDLYDLVEDM